MWKDKQEMVSNPEERIPTAAYIRLSHENGSRGDEGTLLTQIELVHDYIAQSPQLELIDSYIDNGYSGSNFRRPGFERMMDDVMSGKVRCIVVKDLSRFGRDYLDTGTYVETILPRLGVRLISVNDRFDSSRPEDMMSLEFPVRNIVNAMYSRDISKKIKGWFDTQDKKGKWFGHMAPYGYLTSGSGDCATLVPDPATADYVMQIFHWFIEGTSMAEIARRLDKDGAPTPAARRVSLDPNRTRPQTARPRWTLQSVAHILDNQTYTGDTVNRKSVAIAGKTVPQPKDKWSIIPDTHEPLVSRQTFALAQARRKRNMPLV